MIIQQPELFILWLTSKLDPNLPENKEFKILIFSWSQKYIMLLTLESHLTRNESSTIIVSNNV